MVHRSRLVILTRRAGSALKLYPREVRLVPGKSDSADKEEVMLEYWKDGKKIECRPIFNRGYAGQTVILDHVRFGENPDLDKYPLALHPQPQVFIIVEKTEGKEGYYVVADGAAGCRFKLRDEYYGASIDYLYDANEWLAWQKEHNKDKLARKERKIEQLEGHLALLKDILIKQGFRLISEEKARELGIN